MQHKDFYRVPDNCYLFARKTGPEELVRQWTLFELMRFYGYCIDQIEVEKTVQYGTRRGYIDIVINHDNKPFIVIECKRQAGYDKNKDHMKQAISYASADSIQAEFCVFTDGDIWQVKRKTAAGWVNYPNIPKLNSNNETEFDFSVLLHNIDEVKPVLHWLYEPIIGSNSLYFIQAIQPIFCGHSIITTGTNRTLLEIVDNVCRSLTIQSEMNGYHFGKLTTAFKQTQSYLKELGLKNYDGENFEYNLHESLMMPDHQLSEMSEQFTDFDSEMDHAAILLLSSLYSDARYIVGAKDIKEVVLSSALTDSLYNYIDLGLQRNLQTRLPKKSDDMSVNDIRDNCAQNWASHIAVPETKLSDMFSYYLRYMKQKLLS